MAIVDVAMRHLENEQPRDAEQVLFGVIATARNAFSNFPWRLEELVEQAPELYALIQERCETLELSDVVSKRSFVKACKDIAYST